MYIFSHFHKYGCLRQKMHVTLRRMIKGKAYSDEHSVHSPQLFFHFEHQAARDRRRLTT